MQSINASGSYETCTAKPLKWLYRVGSVEAFQFVIDRLYLRTELINCKSDHTVTDPRSTTGQPIPAYQLGLLRRLMVHKCRSYLRTTVEKIPGLACVHKPAHTYHDTPAAARLPQHIVLVELGLRREPSCTPDQSLRCHTVCILPRKPTGE